MINFDETKDRSELDEQLELDNAASAFLWQQVSRIVDDINRDEAMLAGWAKGKDRHQIIAYLESLSSCLEELKGHLAEEDPNTNGVLRSQLGTLVGELLSNQGFEKLIGQSPGYRVTYRLQCARETMSDGRFYQAWDDEVLERRINIARRFTPEILERLVEVLNTPLLRLLDIERQNKGGAPGKRYRNTVVDELVPIYRKSTRRRHDPHQRVNSQRCALWFWRRWASILMVWSQR